jgi:hypothetical protein
MVDFLAKAKRVPQAFKLLPSAMAPEQLNGETWASYPFDESLNLWLNSAHDEVITWLSQIINREKKAVDFAQTFAKRNSLKHLSGLQKSPFGPEWSIPVLSWRPTGKNIVKWDSNQYVQLQAQVIDMIEGDGSVFEVTPNAEIKKGKERASDEQGFKNLETETDPEDQADVINGDSEPQPPQGKSPVSQPTEKKTPPQNSKPSAEAKTTPEPKPEELPKETAKENKQAEQAQKIFPAKYQQACEELGVSDNPLAIDTASAVKVVQKINEYLDMEADAA